MTNLIFCLNATVPIFLMMVLGCVFRKSGLINGKFADQLNAFVFRAALPVLLFQDISESDFFATWNFKFVAFCFLVSLASILISVGLSTFLKDRSIRGEFAQASYRSSLALLGVAFLLNIYGTTGATSLVIIGVVPLYNIAAVIILTIMKPEHGKLSKALILKALKGILTNPIIIGVISGIVWALLRIPQPVILKRSISTFSATATPLGLIALGASFDYHKAFSKLKPALVCTVLKLLVFPAAFLPLAVFLGFRQDKLVSVLTMLGSSTTVTSFTMARSMGHESTLSASAVMLTTFFSAFTLTGWLYILKILMLV